MLDKVESKKERIRDLQDTIESLRIQVKHLENDLRLTKQEYDHSLEEYFKIYSHMERMVDQRTRELQKNQKVLEQKGKELQVMLDSSPALIFYKDKNQRYLRVNKMFSETLGVPIQEIIGKKYSELFPVKKQYGTENDEKVLQEETPILRQNELFETANGTRQLLIDKLPYKNGSGTVIGIIGFALDITELKRAESEKEALEDQLRQAQKMESIGILAGGIAHDFNNVMATIAGAAQLLEFHTQDESLLRYIDMIISSVTRGKSITDRILTFARAESPEIRTIQLNEYLQNIYEIITHTLPTGISVNIEPFNENTHITGDPSHLQQVILNLCINSADAMPEGGEITFTIEEPTKSMLKKHQKNKEEYISLTISDTGVGIDPDTLEHIFEPFFTTKEPGKGTGLGLSVAYKILKQHKGWIDINSEVNVGTKIHLGLPSTMGKALEKSQSEQFHPLQGNGEKILLVDDEDALRSLLSERLKIHGFHITTARNGMEALQLFKSNEQGYDLIITDIKMPEMDGITLYRKLSRIDPDVKILALTGIVEQGRIDRSRDVKFQEILRKPLEIKDFLKAIQKVLL